MEITTRQQEILDAIDSFMTEKGYAPTIRELGEFADLKSPASVHRHINILKQLGYISKPDGKSRAIEITGRNLTPATRNKPAKSAAADFNSARKVPLVGSVAAGTGVLADQRIEEMMVLPPELTGSGELFVLKVRGSSMKDKAILDGDWVVVKSQKSAQNGDIVVAATGEENEEATVKQFFQKGNQVLLSPANPDFKPIELAAEEALIYGKVISVMRRL